MNRTLSFLALLGADVAALLLALSIAVAIRVGLLPKLSAAFAAPSYALSHYGQVAWLLFLYVGALGYAGLYTRRDPVWEEVRRCVGAATVGMILIFAGVSVAKLGDDVSRPVILLTWLALLFVLPVARILTKEALFVAGPWRKRTIIVDPDGQAETLAGAFRRHRTLGYQLAAVVKDPRRARDVAVEVGAQEAVLAVPTMARGELLALVESLRDVTENVLIAPNLSELPVLGMEALSLFEDRAVLLRLPNNLLKPWNLIAKRVMDILLASILLIVTAPLLLLAMIAVRLGSRGPIFHSEPRIGHRRRVFPCHKLRTMYTDADERLAAHLAADAGAAAEWAAYRKLRGHDPRVTRCGRWLRRFSLDEIPQLFNVLAGEMSLVGPRPYLPREMAMVEAERMLDVRPGLTGLWQVSGKNALTFRERGSLDDWYVRNWSPWLDVVILLRTLPVVLNLRRDDAASPRS